MRECVPYQALLFVFTIFACHEQVHYFRRSLEVKESTIRVAVSIAFEPYKLGTCSLPNPSGSIIPTLRY